MLTGNELRKLQRARNVIAEFGLPTMPRDHQLVVRVLDRIIGDLKLALAVGSESTASSAPETRRRATRLEEP